MDRQKLRVVVIDDSRTYREVLKLLLQADGDIEVVGEASDGDEGIEVVLARKPDLVTMDIEMPGLDGLSAIKRIMAELPVPILVVTGRPSNRSTMLFQALEIGALDLVVKPSIVERESAVAFRNVVRRLAGTAVGPRSMSLAPPDAEAEATEASTRREAKMVGIVGSTGGPQATLHILRQLSASFPLPIAIVQHLPPGFEDAYARFLAQSTTLAVEVVRDSVVPTAGTVWLANSSHHLICEAGGKLATTSEPPEGPRPSADVLFRSMADIFGDGAVGIILSGAGTDGVEGLRELRARGALTIAEHERSALANEGPRRAVAEGVIERTMSPQLIGSALVALAYPQERLPTLPPPDG
ncbi:MAG: chemotaxis protein CheB [Myxococcales bacterium]|nr:chemotaxis protein CheB [Myxococcales bacterium]